MPWATWRNVWLNKLRKGTIYCDIIIVSKAAVHENHKQLYTRFRVQAITGRALWPVRSRFYASCMFIWIFCGPNLGRFLRILVSSAKDPWMLAEQLKLTLQWMPNCPAHQSLWLTLCDLWRHTAPSLNALLFLEIINSFQAVIFIILKGQSHQETLWIRQKGRHCQTYRRYRNPQWIVGWVCEPRRRPALLYEGRTEAQVFRTARSPKWCPAKRGTKQITRIWISCSWKDKRSTMSSQRYKNQRKVVGVRCVTSQLEMQFASP